MALWYNLGECRLPYDLEWHNLITWSSYGISVRREDMCGARTVHRAWIEDELGAAPAMETAIFRIAIISSRCRIGRSCAGKAQRLSPLRWPRGPGMGMIRGAPNSKQAHVTAWWLNKHNLKARDRENHLRRANHSEQSRVTWELVTGGPGKNNTGLGPVDSSIVSR